MKSIIFGSTRFSLGQLGISDMIIAIRTASDIPEKKVYKALVELREKLKNYFENKAALNHQNQPMVNIGFNLELDEGINDIFFSMG